MSAPLVSLPIQCPQCDNVDHFSCRFTEQDFVVKCSNCKEKILASVSLSETPSSLSINVHTRKVASRPTVQSTTELKARAEIARAVAA